MTTGINPFKYSIFQLLHKLKKYKETNSIENYVDESIQKGDDFNSKKSTTILGMTAAAFFIILILNLLFFFLTIVWIVKCSPIMSSFTKWGLWILVILGLFVPGLSFIAFIWAVIYRYQSDCGKLGYCMKDGKDSKCK